MMTTTRQKLFAAIALLLTALPAAHAAASVATALPEVVSSSGALSTTLYVDEFIMTDSTGTNKIRGFGTTAVLAGTDTTNVLRPGPLIRCKAGDQLTVVLVNNLGTAGQQGADWGGTHTTNSHTDSDSTNLHTHGLHIDSDSPQDNVLNEVTRGTSYTYVYQVASDHMGGTHWYHPHHHGSTAIQVAGGMAGVIIIDDAANEVSPEIKAISGAGVEVVLLIQKLEPDRIKSIANAVANSADTWSNGQSSTLTDLYFINGALASTMTGSIDQNTWTRVRMVLSGLKTAGTIAHDGSSLGCEWKLLAKDGVYVRNAPRSLNTVHLGPGNRADVVLRCTSTGTFTFKITDETNSAYTLITWTVASSSTAATDIPTFNAVVPAYIADVLDTGPVASNMADLGLSYVEHEMKIQGAAGGTCTMGFDSYQAAYSSGVAHGTMTAGTVQKWKISGQGGHPYHIHVNNFQLGSDTTDTNSYYVKGDWHDVLYEPSTAKVSTVYFSADSHTGKAVLHCHFLEHEDKGCMGYVTIDGTEGATTGLCGWPNSAYSYEAFDYDSGYSCTSSESFWTITVIILIVVFGALFVFLVAIAIMKRSAIKECCSGNRNSKQSSHNKRELVPVMVPVHQLGQQAPVVAPTAATT